MGVFAQIEGSVNAQVAPVFTDGLGNGEDMRFGKRAFQGGTAVTASAEANVLFGILHIGAVVIICFFKQRYVYQHFFRNGFPCKR